MPWSSSDASGKTHKANTGPKKRVWADVANKSLARDGDEGAAIRKANAAVSRIGLSKAPGQH